MLDDAWLVDVVNLALPGEVWCEWIEMELRHKEYDQALKARTDPQPNECHRHRWGNPPVFMDTPMIKQAVSEKMRALKV